MQPRASLLKFAAARQSAGEAAVPADLLDPEAGPDALAGLCADDIGSVTRLLRLLTHSLWAASEWRHLVAIGERARRAIPVAALRFDWQQAPGRGAWSGASAADAALLALPASELAPSLGKRLASGKSSAPVPSETINSMLKVSSSTFAQRICGRRVLASPVAHS